MKTRRLYSMLLVGMSVAFALAPTIGVADPSPSPVSNDTLDSQAIVAGLNMAFLGTLAVTALAGGLGGLIFELIALQGNIEIPHFGTSAERNESLAPYALAGKLLDLGVVARVVIGAAAAVAVTLFIAPPTLFKLLASSIIAGSAGIAVFRSMQDRLLATVAQRDVAELKAKSTQASALVKEAKQAVKSEKGKRSPKRAASRATPDEPAVSGFGLDHAELMLDRAAMLYEDIQDGDKG